jgi:hypothetical protein
MGNKNMIDFRKLEFVFAQLHLCSLSAINKKHTVANFQNLCGWIGNSSWRGCVATQKG